MGLVEEALRKIKRLETELQAAERRGDELREWIQGVADDKHVPDLLRREARRVLAERDSTEGEQ